MELSLMLLYLFISHRHGVARYESVMELRDYLEQLGAMEGANRDEKGILANILCAHTFQH